LKNQLENLLIFLPRRSGQFSDGVDWITRWSAISRENTCIYCIVGTRSARELQHQCFRTERPKHSINEHRPRINRTGQRLPRGPITARITLRVIS